jgi:catechol 2,3-dioxygenase-like lactoylglutathione lyase family enzyme
MNATFDHIALESNDIAESIAFYKQQFQDVEVLYEDASWGFIKAGGIKIAFVTPGEHPPHICFTVKTHDELEALAAEFGKKIKIHRDKTESFYITDPSGNPVEILWYP